MNLVREQKCSHSNDSWLVRHVEMSISESWDTTKSNSQSKYAGIQQRYFYLHEGLTRTTELLENTNVYYASKTNQYRNTQESLCVQQSPSSLLNNFQNTTRVSLRVQL